MIVITKHFEFHLHPKMRICMEAFMTLNNSTNAVTEIAIE